MFSCCPRHCPPLTDGKSAAPTPRREGYGADLGSLGGQHAYRGSDHPSHTRAQ